ncbi:MAG: hypothetical protein ACLRFO_02285 [Alphaproteobacteria bacterium]
MEHSEGSIVKTGCWEPRMAFSSDTCDKFSLNKVFKLRNDKCK